MKLVLTFLLVIILNNLCNSQCNNELEKYAVGFDALKVNSFTFLDDKLKGVRVVGYGEDTHGAFEFTTLTEELMKYLSKKHR
ncbi:MAG: hypothetical protein BM557_04470 [Flavobacterium sp. MedPE-SWcel]|uniref:hypothetical protein n=1 Tax=uncultured Flavobacterium sp. TaxID=165435 RepID=UPI00091BA0ED|nr:hypothetical protein [uncultured Flavobacterium sp.]OIQ21021.1 MAG: hypothetical protein BM557_04470 [Flavobacterium sp. MedPE-SWcel]